MSGYMPAQGLIADLLNTMTEFLPDGVTEGDPRVIDSGRAHMGLLFPGAVVEYNTEENATEHNWEVLLDIFERFLSDENYKTFGTFRDSVLAKLNAGAALSDDYMITGVRSAGDPSDFVEKNSRAVFAVTQQLVISVREYIF